MAVFPEALRRDRRPVRLWIMENLEHPRLRAATGVPDAYRIGSLYGALGRI